jgi:hypothetical protein
MSFKAMCLVVVSTKLHFIRIFLVQLEILDVRVNTERGGEPPLSNGSRHGENVEVHSAAFPTPSDSLWAAVIIVRGLSAEHEGEHYSGRGRALMDTVCNSHMTSVCWFLETTFIFLPQYACSPPHRRVVQKGAINKQFRGLLTHLCIPTVQRSFQLPPT